MGIDSGIDSGFDLVFAAVQSANSEQAGEDRTNEKGEQACACRREPPTKELRSSSFLTQKTSGHAQLKDGRLCKSDALVRGYSSEPAGLCLTARLLSGHKDVQDVTALLLTKPNVNYLASVGNRRPKALCACGAQDMTTHQRILRGVCTGKPKAPSVYSYTPDWLWTGTHRRPQGLPMQEPATQRVRQPRHEDDIWRLAWIASRCALTLADSVTRCVGSHHLLAPWFA